MANDTAHGLLLVPSWERFFVLILAALTAGAFPLPLSALRAQEPAADKVPAPNNAARVEALALVWEVFKVDFERAKTAGDQEALAKKLLGRAAESRDHPAEQYALLEVSRDIATQVGDGATAFEAADQMADAFRVDAVDMKAGILAELAKNAKTASKHKFIVENAFALIDHAVVADRFDVADTLGTTALASVRQAGGAALTQRLRSRMDEVEKTARAFDAMKAASATLQNKPSDPDANLIVGNYLCLEKGTWDRGLPMLALGSDPELKALALKELEAPTLAPDQVKLGDGWWTLALKYEGPARSVLQKRAVHWYRLALPALSGLVKDKVLRRTSELGFVIQVQPVKFEVRSGSPGGLAVAAKDLVNQGQTTIESVEMVEGRAGGYSELRAINDGDAYANQPIIHDQPSFMPVGQTTILFTLKTVTASRGYDILSIVSLSGSGGGNQQRSRQNYVIDVAAPNSQEFVRVADVVNLGALANEVQVTTVSSNGKPLAENVGRIRVTFRETNSPEPQTMYREFDIIGRLSRGP